MWECPLQCPWAHSDCGARRSKIEKPFQERKVDFARNRFEGKSRKADVARKRFDDETRKVDFTRSLFERNNNTADLARSSSDHKTRKNDFVTIHFEGKSHEVFVARSRFNDQLGKAMLQEFVSTWTVEKLNLQELASTGKCRCCENWPRRHTMFESNFKHTTEAWPTQDPKPAHGNPWVGFPTPTRSAMSMTFWISKEPPVPVK